MFERLKKLIKKGETTNAFNDAAEIPVPSPSSNKLLDLAKKHLTPILILITALVSIGFYLAASKTPNLVFRSEPKYLEIISARPRGTLNNPQTSIIIEFNQPVAAHHAQGFIEITPIVDGQFIQGSNNREITFTPREGWSQGSYIQVVIKKGLPSETGKRLTQDYTFDFSIGYSNDIITFKNGELTGKFMSFDQRQGAKLTVDIGSEIRNPKVKIYKASTNLLLNSLLYKSDEKTKSYALSGQYLENQIDTSKLELVQEFTTITNYQEINFNKPVGLYLFQALDGEKVVNNAWVTLNRSAIHFRQDDQSVFLAAQNLETGNPESGLNINFYTLTDKPEELAKHTLSSIQEYPLPYETRLDLVIGQKGDDILVVPVQIPNSQAEIRRYQDLNSKHQIFIYTDRPIYKVGDKVSFRGLVRLDNDGLYKMPSANTKVRVFIDNYTSAGTSRIYDQTLSLQDGGVFSGELAVTQDMLRRGTIYLYATDKVDQAENYSSSYAYFDVFEYIKPDFGLDVAIEKGEYIKGDTIKATITGNYFDGRPLANQKIKYSIYRRDYFETEKAVYNQSFNLNGWGGMCGGGFGQDDEYYGQQLGKETEVTLDSNGKAVVEFQTGQLQPVLSQEITVVAERENEKAPVQTPIASDYYGPDYSSRKIVAAKNTVVHQGEFNIFIRPGANRMTSGDELVASFYTENLAGQNLANQNFSYEFYEESYVSTDNYSRKVLKTGSVTTDANGVGIIKDSLTVDNDIGLYFAVKGKDSRGNNIENRKYIYVQSKNSPNYSKYWGWRDPASQVQLKITSAKSNLTPGTKATLDIIAPQDLTVLTSFERGRVYDPQWLNLKKGQNTYTFDVTSEYTPSITPTFSFFMNGEHFIEGLSLNVPALEKLITVEISTDKEKYAPGETALVTVLTKDAKGNLISANVGLGIVDKAIFALRKSAAQPIHSSFYFFRPRSTNSSSSLTWIATFGGGGGGGGGGGEALFRKDADTLYWNANLRTGSDGRLIVPVTLGNTQTTWRIVGYASTSDSFFGQGEKDFLVAK